jgi:hypothetical protein
MVSQPLVTRARLFRFKLIVNRSFRPSALRCSLGFERGKVCAPRLGIPAVAFLLRFPFLSFGGFDCCTLRRDNLLRRHPFGSFVD